MMFIAYVAFVCFCALLMLRRYVVRFLLCYDSIVLCMINCSYLNNHAILSRDEFKADSAFCVQDVGWRLM